MIKVLPGKYIVAVSGGVDSVVLLNLLSKQNNLELVVAHFNHGIRAESHIDEEFVRALATNYRIAYEIGYGKLGQNASEQTARKARYNFLFKVQKKHKAKAVVTAHHQDDLIETAIINILRGTDRKGLSSITDTGIILRPLLDLDKTQILNYAKKHKLDWVEDKSNTDTKYLRNKVRHEVMPKINANKDDKEKILKILKNAKMINQKIDSQTEILSKLLVDNSKNKQIFVILPDNVARELIANILRQYKVKDIKKKLITDTVTHIKTGKNGDVYNIDKYVNLHIGKENFWFAKN